METQKENQNNLQISKCFDVITGRPRNEAEVRTNVYQNQKSILELTFELEKIPVEKLIEPIETRQKPTEEVDSDIVSHLPNGIPLYKSDDPGEIYKPLVRIPHLAPVEKEWLHLQKIAGVSSDNLDSVRKQIKLLIDKKLIGMDIDNIRDDELINKLVALQAGTLFHNSDTGPVELNGAILAIPVETHGYYEEKSREFLYVANLGDDKWNDGKKKKRRDKNCTTYSIPNTDIKHRTIHTGLYLHVCNNQTIELQKSETGKSYIRWK